MHTPRSISKIRPVSALRLACVVGLGVGLIGVAAAQQSTATPPPSALAPSAPTTATEQLASAERIVTHAQALKIAMNQRLEAAGRRSDIVMVDCLTPLVAQLEASLAGGEARLRALRLLARGGDPAAVQHEYTMISVLEPRFHLVEADMNQCLGDSDITTGDDQLTVEMTITLPDEDASAVIEQPPVVAVPLIPPPLSPAF